MASTGSTEYSAENYTRQGSTETVIGGMLKFLANGTLRFGASTYATGSTIPSDGFSVLGANSTYILSSPKQGAVGILCVTASSSGTACVVHTNSSAINLDGTNDQIAFNVPGAAVLYAHSTSQFQLLAVYPPNVTATSSEVVLSARAT